MNCIKLIVTGTAYVTATVNYYGRMVTLVTKSHVCVRDIPFIRFFIHVCITEQNTDVNTNCNVMVYACISIHYEYATCKYIL